MLLLAVIMTVVSGIFLSAGVVFAFCAVVMKIRKLCRGAGDEGEVSDSGSAL